MGDAPPKPLADEKAEAFALARRRFAMYGSRHARVSHLGSTASRAASSSGFAPLKSSLALQENGALALRLDDLRYRLDGALSAIDEAVAAQNIAELAHSFLRLEPAQLALALSKEHVHARVRNVLALMETRCSDALKPRALDLTVAVLALALTQSACTEEIFTGDVLDVLVAAVGAEADAEMDASTADRRVTTPLRASTVAATDDVQPTRRTCLKRKLTAAPSRQRTSSFGSSSDDSLVEEAEEKKPASGQDVMTQLLQSVPAFCVDGTLVERVSPADVITVALDRLLQVERPDDGERQGDDRADAVFARARDDRKRRLVANGGLDALVRSLASRFRPLQACVLEVTRHTVAAEATRLLWRLQVVLRVLDHASFLAKPAQQFLARQHALVEILLECVEHMSELCWGARRWELAGAGPSFAHLMADVLLVAVRVLINLTHHNDDAATQIHSLHGTGVLFRAFCRLWGFIEAASERGETPVDGTAPSFEEKVLFDALLVTLSALTNCVEFSEENRRALSTVAMPASVVVGLERFQCSGSSCGLLAHFFLGKVQSFVHFFNTSESRESHPSSLWVPEDVVLGGCASLLLGCLMNNSPANASAILAVLPDRSPRLLLRALSAFVALHSQIGTLTPEVGDSVLQVEQTLKSFDPDASFGFVLTDARTAVLAPLELKFSVVSVKAVVQEALTLPLGSNTDRIDRATPSHALKTGDHTPPAAAFKLQWRTNVCATVDSDTDDGGDGETLSEATQSAPRPVNTTPTKRWPKKLSARSPGARSSALTARRSPGVRTPNKVGTSESSTSAAQSSRSRSEMMPTREEHTQPSAALANRTRQLVAELATKLAQVSDDDDGNGAPVRVPAVSKTPPPRRSSSWRVDNDDDDDDLDFSRDRVAAQSASPGARSLSRDSSPLPFGARKRVRVGRLHAQNSPSRLPLSLVALLQPRVRLTTATLEAVSSSSRLSPPLSRSPSTSRSQVTLSGQVTADGVLRRKQKATAKPPLPRVPPHSQQQHTSSCSAVFDFDDA